MRNEVQINNEGPEAQEGRGRFSISWSFMIKLMLFPKIPLTKSVLSEQENKKPMFCELSSTSSQTCDLFVFWLCAPFPSVIRPDSVGWETLKTVVLGVVIHKSPSVFPSDRDVDWDKWESPTELLINEVGMQWLSMAKVLTDFYPSTLKITGEKKVMDIPAERALFVVLTLHCNISEHVFFHLLRE